MRRPHSAHAVKDFGAREASVRNLLDGSHIADRPNQKKKAATLTMAERRASALTATVRSVAELSEKGEESDLAKELASHASLWDVVEAACGKYKERVCFSIKGEADSEKHQGPYSQRDYRGG